MPLHAMGYPAKSPDRNSVSFVNSSRESLKPGTSRVTTSTQIPICVQSEDRVQNRLEASSKLTIMPVVVAFQIDFEQIKM